jgi:hypothetical protein
MALPDQSRTGVGLDFRAAFDELIASYPTLPTEVVLAAVLQWDDAARMCGAPRTRRLLAAAARCNLDAVVAARATAHT